MTARFVTFYSYKGGVGRTFVLANVAALLAEWGWKVLAIDFDLEAPGLAPYFELDRTLDPHPGGLLDLLLARQNQVDGVRWQNLVRRVSFPAIDAVLGPAARWTAPGGHIDVLDAGAPGPDYTRRLATLDWSRLFSKGPDLGNHLEYWREEWGEAYDLVLIDSRTGLTDVQGITTAQLPDVVVFLFTGNRQSVNGSLDTMKLSLRQQAALPYGRLAPWIVPLPARFDTRANAVQCAYWLGEFAKTFEPFYRDWQDEVPVTRLLELLRVDYFPRWSLDERIAVRAESITEPGVVSAQLARIAAAVARGFEDVRGLAENERAWIADARKVLDRDVWIVGPNKVARQDLAFALERPGLLAHTASVEADATDDLDRAVREGFERAGHVVVLPRDNGRPTPRQLDVIERAVHSGRQVLYVGDAAMLALLDEAVAGRVTVRPPGESGVVAAGIRAWLGVDDAPLPVVRPKDTLARYLATVRERHRNLVPFFAGARSGLLAEVYVDVSVSQEVKVDLDEQRRLLERDVEALSGEATLAQHTKNLGKALVRGMVLAAADAQQNLGDLLQRGRRWLVLGEPGAGKSTLIRHLSAEAAADPDGAVPIFLSLARFGGTAPDPLLAAAQDARDVDSSLRVADVHDVLKAAAQDGRLWLFLDGLDEVDLKDQEAVVTWIRGLSRREDLAKAAIVVTSRPVAVEKRGLDASFKVVKVQPLQEGAQRRLLGNLLGEDEARPVWAELSRRPALRSMAGNPLLLTLIAMIGREEAARGGALPAKRTRLYAASVELLLERGHCLEPRGVKDRALAREVLRELAWRLHETGREAWTSEELEVAVWALIEGDPALGKRLLLIWDGPGRFLEDVGHNAGILGPHDGPGAPWRFLHRSLREFLVAERLAASTEEVRTAFREQWVGALQEVAKAAAAERERRRGAPKGSPTAPAAPADPVDPARWGEVYALLCGLVSDPAPYLAPLRSLPRDIAKRALVALDDLAPAQSLAFLLSLGEVQAEEVTEVFDRMEVAVEARVVLLDGAVAPGQDPHTLGVLWSMRAALGGEPDRDVFFITAGRPRAAVPAIRVIRVDNAAKRTFWMGSPDDVGHDDERPRHRVTLSRPFGLGRAPVTVAEYRAFWPEHTCSGSDLHPVTEVDWYEATAFAAWVGGRLPTEEEWECACRAGTTTKWSFGDDEAKLGEHAWFDGNAGSRTHAVGEKKANPWGFVDLHGQVWEWCFDAFGLYEGADVVDPVRPVGGGRVMRGGSAWYAPDGCRSAIRGRNHPSVRDFSIGFRVAFP